MTLQFSKFMTVTTKLTKLLSQTFLMSINVTVIFDFNPTVWPMDFVFIIEHTSYNHSFFVWIPSMGMLK